MRVQHQPAYILHQWPYSETSWLLDVFTRDYGRVSLLAKGARRLKSPLRSLTSPFVPLLISFSGKGEVQTLTEADALTPTHFYTADKWIRLTYFNELLIKIMHRHDPHERLFDAYHYLVSYFQERNTLPEIMLRHFEIYILKEIGYGIVFEHDTTEEMILDDAFYHYYADLGAKKVALNHEYVDYENISAPRVSGKTLTYLSQQNDQMMEMVNRPLSFQEQISASSSEFLDFKVSQQSALQITRESKILLRYIFERVLEWRELKTRKIFINIREYTGS